MLRRFGFLILCFTIAAYAIEADEYSEEDDIELPAGTITCQIDSPDRDECIKEAVQDMLPRLKNGMPSLNIPPLDPFVVERNEVNFKRGSAIFASGSVRNVRAYGLTDAKLIDFKSNMTRTRMDTITKASLPRLVIEGYYRGEGRFNNLKFKSKGYFNLTATDIQVVGSTSGVIVNENGKEYLKIVHLEAIPTIGDMTVYATGILPDPELNRVAVELINQYWPFMYKDLFAETHDIWEPVLLKDMNKFLSYVPIRKILYYSDSSTA